MTALKQRGKDEGLVVMSNSAKKVAKFQTTIDIRQRPRLSLRSKVASACYYLDSCNDPIIRNKNASCGGIINHYPHRHELLSNSVTRRPRMWIGSHGQSATILPSNQLSYTSDKPGSNGRISNEEKIAAECLSTLFFQGMSSSTTPTILTKANIDSLQRGRGKLDDNVILKGARRYRAPLKMDSFGCWPDKYYYEDDDSMMNEEDDDEFVSDSYDSSSSSISYASTTIGKRRLTDKKKRMVNFERTVQVVEIANRRSFTLKQRQRMWNSNKVIRANVKRNRIEYEWEGWDWRNVLEEDHFSTNINGEKVHPVHVKVPACTPDNTP